VDSTSHRGEAATTRDADPFTNRWAIPYIDAPPSFWESLDSDLGPFISEVYFPLPSAVIGSGRPQQPERYRREFLTRAPVRKAALVNVVTLPRPAEELAPAIVEELRRLRDDHGIVGATVADLSLARRIRDALPSFSLTASVLMDIAEPFQAKALEGVCDTLVPASRIVRDLPALRELRAAFPGTIRLLVNEACLAGCPYRIQHFHEMASGVDRPKSLCAELLSTQPWMRLTGGWVLPQYLHFYEGVYDELKLAGRVTLANEARYREVFSAFVQRRPLRPDSIGGGPSSVVEPIEMDDALFEYTLTCGRRCHTCTRCPDYYERAIAQLVHDSL